MSKCSWGCPPKLEGTYKTVNLAGGADGLPIHDFDMHMSALKAGSQVTNQLDSLSTAAIPPAKGNGPSI